MSQPEPVEAPGTEEVSAGGKKHVSNALQYMTSMRVETELIQQQYQEAHQAGTPKKAPAKKAPAKAKSEKPPSRRQRSEIVHTIMPPPRVTSHLRAALETDKSAKHAQLSTKIRKLKALLAKTELTAEEIEKGGQLLTDDQRIIAQQRIDECQAEIVKEKLGDDVVRLSENTGPALAAAMDFILLHLYDLAAANTVAAQYKVVDAKYFLSPAHCPAEIAGGKRMSHSPVAPFFTHLPVFADYDQKAEDQLASERCAANKEKRAAREAKAALAAQEAIAAAKEAEKAEASADAAEEESESEASTEAAEAAPTTEADASDKPAKPAAKKPAAPRKQGQELQFHSYTDEICSAGKDLHPSYANLRAAARFKDIMNLGACQFIKALGHALRNNIKTHTVQGSDIQDALCFLQKIAGRPESEIEALKASIQQALSLWEEYSLEEKKRKTERETQKIAAMTEEERAAYELKRRKEEEQRLQNSIAAQEKRAKKAAETAEEKRARLAQVEAEAKKVAAQVAPATTSDAAAALLS